MAAHRGSPGGTPARRHDLGFTLIEMLVSLAIIAMMASMLLAGLWTTGGVVRRMNSQSSSAEEVITAQRLLRSRLEQLRAVIRSDSSTLTVDAQGDEGSFSFIAPPLARSEPDAIWRYRIMATATGDFVLYHANTLDRRFDFGAPGAAGWQPVTLLENVASIRINYFGRDIQGTGRRWQTRWQRRPQPPDLVRIRLSFPPGDNRVWPDLIVRPRATINTACKIDALSGRCESET